MATVQVKVNGAGLLDYAKAGRDAVKRVTATMRGLLNMGRKEARQQIASQFRVRTGFLSRQARKIQTKVTVKSAEIKGQVTPLPRLLNIFEHGATLAYGRGILHPRPVVAPAASVMEQQADKAFDSLLGQVGR